MSMGTSWYADYANGVKDKWVEKLKKVKSMNELNKVIHEIEDFGFSE